jgi:hypothetical protein
MSDWQRKSSDTFRGHLDFFLVFKEMALSYIHSGTFVI